MVRPLVVSRILWTAVAATLWTLFTGIGASFSASELRANIGGNAAAATDRILYDTKTGTLYYDADGSGGGGKIAFATIDTKSLIGTVDFTDFVYGTPPLGP